MNYLLTNQETERLRFRRLLENDFEAWLPLFAEKDVSKFLGMDNTLTSKEMCEQWFTKCFQRYDNNLGGMNVLLDKETGELIGQCGILIQEVEGERRFEIGYSILPKYWNRGFASEASKKCLDHAFELKVAPSIISVIHPENIGSETVARKNGMSLEKYIKNYQGGPVNIFSISEEVWKNTH